MKLLPLNTWVQQGPKKNQQCINLLFGNPRRQTYSHPVKRQQREAENRTSIPISHNFEIDIRLYPRDWTSITLSMCLSFDMATLPKPKTLPLLLSPKVIYFCEE